MDIDLLKDIFLLSVLGWYIPGLSELPLGHRLLLLLAGESLVCFFFLFGVHACIQSCLFPERTRLVRF